VSGVSATIAKTKYSTKEFKLFYESILYLYNYERMLYNKLYPAAKDQLHKQLLKSITTIEEEVDRRKQS
jgi:hypothetical protein